MSQPTNSAVFQDAPGIPSTIRDAPYPTSLLPSQLLLHVHAWAINPADAFVQDTPLPFISYPVILGEDIAGTVVEIGASVKDLEEGDRVLAFAMGSSVKMNSQGGFQDYAIVEGRFAVKVPDRMGFAEAAVFPLGIMTAGIGLFSRHFLNLPLPLPLALPELKETGGDDAVGETNSSVVGKAILIWGGSSSVGCNAIQLAKAIGLSVVTACSEHNFEYVRALGADAVFDYAAIADIVAYLDGTTCVGIFQAAGGPGLGDVRPPALVAAQCREKLFIATTNFVVLGSVPEGVEARFLGEAVGLEGGMEGVRRDVVGPVFEYLGWALGVGRYTAAPRVDVVGTRGLEGVQEGIDVVRNGGSARKVVVLRE